MDIKTKTLISFYRTYFKVLSSVSPGLAGKVALKRFSTPRFRKIRSKKLPIFNLCQTNFELINGQKIAHYYWQGENDKCILLAHGWESDSGTFAGMIEYFLNKGWSLRAVDAPAHGQSEGNIIRLPNYAAILEFMIDKYPDISSAVGHSFGAMALAYANDQNNLEKSFPPFVLIASALELRESMAPFIRILKLNQPAINAFYKAIEDLGNKPVSWYSVKRMVSGNNTPTLILHDEFDKICPIQDLYPVIELKLPHITYHITNGLGHNRIVKEEDSWNKVEKFLNDNLLNSFQ